MTMHVHVLKGCSPTPLAGYLKALGILRLLSEQKNPDIRGWWRGEHFCLMTRLSDSEIETFFLNEYQPTPLISPWNKGCGFFKPDDPGMAPIERSQAARMKPFRDAIDEARQLLDEISAADAAIRAIKARTKTTTKGFQSEEQRRHLECCDVYQSMLQQARQAAVDPSVNDEARAAAADHVHVLESLTRAGDKPPTKAQAEALKKSAAYKRLSAAADREFKRLKSSLIPDCRLRWRGPHARWLAAAVVLDENGDPDWPSLLGTGGNDGNLDFTNNFMQQLVGLFDITASEETPSPIASALLKNSLWEQTANQLASAAVGQYQPGAAGGANSSTGFASGNLVNAWDFILMMEGTVLFASIATRRLDPAASASASAPFAVRPHAAGYSTPGSEKSQRGEQWLPIWPQPASLPELVTLLGEARMQIDRRTVNRPIDAARAVSRLGVARGIDAFVRYGYLERNGQSTLAVPLGRVQVRQRPRAFLIDDLAGWLDRLQMRSRDSNAPARLIHAERRLGDSVFNALTHDDAPQRWQDVLLAAVEIEAIQASGTAIDAGPIPALRPDWIKAIDDGSAEVRLAVALGSAATAYSGKGRPFDSVRYNLLPLKPGGRRFAMAEKRLVNDPRVVVSGRDPLRDMAAIVQRRLIETQTEGQRRSRLVAAPGCGARLGDLAQFLAGAVDVEKLFGLARALMALKWDQVTRQHLPTSKPSDDCPEECWLAIRLCCLPWPLGTDRDIPADERIVRLLVIGDAARAVDFARQRIRSVRIRPPMQAGVIDSATARYWAAALVFPIHRDTAFRAASILDPSLKTKGVTHA